MTLKEALDTIAKHCRSTNCVVCELSQSRNVMNKDYCWCKLLTESPEDYDKIEVME